MGDGLGSVRAGCVSWLGGYFVAIFDLFDVRLRARTDTNSLPKRCILGTLKRIFHN
jgi:hypothetical protein